MAPSWQGSRGALVLAHQAFGCWNATWKPCKCRCPELKQWAQPAEAAAQAALQSGTSVSEFHEAIGILATLHAHKVISKDLNTQQVRGISSLQVFHSGAHITSKLNCM